MPRAQTKARADKEPIQLFIYTGGVAALWREGESYRFYANGNVLVDTNDIEAAYDVVYDFQEEVEERLRAQGLIRDISDDV